jgi:hypothetical protein
MTNMQQTRIEPVDGVELNPPCGGHWLRDADGGLTPADAPTAAAAGLAWPAAETIPALET